MSQGFYKRRRGILEHLEAGAISLLDLAVHDYLSLTANLVVGNGSSIPPGVCITSAVAIHATCPSQISERAIQRSLKHLKKIGWIKSWNVPGKRGNYPILVCRASVHDLSGKEYRVNGEATSDWKQPALIPVGELSSLPSEADANLSGDREVRTEKERQEKKNHAAKPAAPPDSRFQPIVDGYYEGMKKAGIEPNCDRSDFGALGAWLKKNPSRPLAGVVASLSNAFASTDHFPLRPGFRLREFLEHESKYQRGPLLKTDPKPIRPIVSPPRNELTDAGAQKIKAYRVVQ